MRKGLAGIGLGEFLIRQAVQRLSGNTQEFQQCNANVFCTLSPIPKFRKWLQERAALVNTNIELGVKQAPLMSDTDISRLALALCCSPHEVISKLLEILDHRGPEFFSLEQQQLEESKIDRDKFVALLESILMKLAARYLVQEKRHHKPYCGVASFHLGNGACLDRINWKADLSRKGWSNSFGIMVNYRYPCNENGDSRDIGTHNLSKIKPVIRPNIRQGNAINGAFPISVSNQVMSLIEKS